MRIKLVMATNNANKLREAREHLRVPLVGGLVADAVELLGERDGGLADLHVLREVHEHRAGSSGGCDVECVADGLRDIVGVLDHEAVLHDGHGDAHDIGFLEGIRADDRTGHLAGDDDQRHAVHVSGGDAGDGVRGTGTRRDDDRSRTARGTCIAIGRMHGALLVARQVMADDLRVVQRIVHLDGLPARVTEHHVDALGFKRGDNRLRADHARAFLFRMRPVARLAARVGPFLGFVTHTRYAPLSALVTSWE